ncbi:MAG: UbiD family decarboxylase, partial [Alistipes sp.]|nr:UbiD family decarboxylase [Alistipes sp.]
MYKNLREYIARLEQEGELVRVKRPVSTRFEIAEITDRVVKSEGGGKAILFENTGTEFPVITNMMGSSRRIAMALGVESLDEIGGRISALLGDALSPKATLWDKMRMLPL